MAGKTVRLRSSAGVVVETTQDVADTLLRSGYEAEKPARKSSRKSSDDE